MFSSRTQAGQLLAKELEKQHVGGDLVLGIARGGVVVATEISKALQISLDILVVKKLGAPSNQELAIGALTYGDVTYIDEKLTTSIGINKRFIAEEVKKKHHEFWEREKLIREGKSPPSVYQKHVILVDDGMATGATVIAGIEWLRQQKAEKVILALPVAPFQTTSRFASLVDQCVILEELENFHAVGESYKDFREVSEEEIKKLLSRQSSVVR